MDSPDATNWPALFTSMMDTLMIIPERKIFVVEHQVAPIIIQNPIGE